MMNCHKNKFSIGLKIKTIGQEKKFDNTKTMNNC
jgi:hypothetical protein